MICDHERRFISPLDYAQLTSSHAVGRIESNQSFTRTNSKFAFYYMMFNINININIGSGNRVISKEKPTINIIIEPAKRIDILLYHIVAH